MRSRHLRVEPPAGNPAATSGEKPMTTRQLADWFQVSERTIRKWKPRRLPGPGHPRYLLSQVLADREMGEARSA